MTATIIASLLALLAACGVQPSSPTEWSPTVETGKDQHFCCNDVDAGTGDGCTAIGVESINSCASVLYCSGSWEKKDGNVTCL